MRMRIQRNKAAWEEIWFESKTRSTKAYRDWAMGAERVCHGRYFGRGCGKKAFDVVRSHADLELLVSRWSMEMHTFITS